MPPAGSRTRMPAGAAFRPGPPGTALYGAAGGPDRLRARPLRLFRPQPGAEPAARGTRLPRVGKAAVSARSPTSYLALPRAPRIMRGDAVGEPNDATLHHAGSLQPRGDRRHDSEAGGPVVDSRQADRGRWRQDAGLLHHLRRVRLAD